MSDTLDWVWVAICVSLVVVPYAWAWITTRLETRCQDKMRAD